MHTYHLSVLSLHTQSADHEASAAAGKRAKAGKREMRPTRAQLILSAPQQVRTFTGFKA